MSFILPIRNLLFKLIFSRSWIMDHLYRWRGNSFPFFSYQKLKEILIRYRRINLKDSKDRLISKIWRVWLKKWKWVPSPSVEASLSRSINPMGRNYVDKFVDFFDRLPSSVDIFHLIKVDEKSPFLNYLSLFLSTQFLNAP